MISYRRFQQFFIAATKPNEKRDFSLEPAVKRVRFEAVNNTAPNGLPVLISHFSCVFLTNGKCKTSRFLNNQHGNVVQSAKSDSKMVWEKKEGSEN